MKRVYILYTQSNVCCGVYSSFKMLKVGVDYWRKSLPEETLSYKIWELNCEHRFEWDWAFIPKTEKKANLTTGGGAVPAKKFWGRNLIGIEWYKQRI